MCRIFCCTNLLYLSILKFLCLLGYSQKNCKSVVHIWYKVTMFQEPIVLYRCVIYQIVQNWQLYKTLTQNWHLYTTYIYKIANGYRVICKTNKILEAILNFHIKTVKSRLTNKKFVFSIPKLVRKSCLLSFPQKCLVNHFPDTYFKI